MFKNRIRERRQDLGLTQTALARLVGVPDSAMSNPELGKWKPWPKVRKDISKVLNKSQTYLFED